MRRHPALARWNPTPVYALALASALVCYIIAALVAFQLHVPNRYSQRLLEIAAPLALGHLIGMGCVLAAERGRRMLVTAVMLVLTLALFAGAGLLKVVRPARPADPVAVVFVAGLPPTSHIVGISNYQASWPALVGRSVLATPEHAIPYHKGYFGEIDARLEAGVAAMATDRRDVLAAYVRRWGVTHVAVDRTFIGDGQMPKDYAAVVPDAVTKAATAMADHPSLVRRYALSCAVYAGPAVVLADPACILAKAP